jgi:hypothetical protein
MFSQQRSVLYSENKSVSKMSARLHVSKSPNFVLSAKRLFCCISTNGGVGLGSVHGAIAAGVSCGCDVSQRWIRSTVLELVGCAWSHGGRCRC